MGLPRARKKTTKTTTTKKKTGVFLSARTRKENLLLRGCGLKRRDLGVAGHVYDLVVKEKRIGEAAAVVRRNNLFGQHKKGFEHDIDCIRKFVKFVKANDLLDILKGR